ncbi:MAG: alpha/beta hydrolase [Ignavibacteriales bacterium]|nr:alpha/beta hydrolase [Ignavibacteriales bacterium]
MVIEFLHTVIRWRLRRLGVQSKTVDLGNCSLHYYEYQHPAPQGTVVLVHGLGTSSSTWINVFPFFIKKFHVIALDLPGFGFSRIRNGNKFFSISEHLNTLKKFIEWKELQSYILVGHSMGGWLAAKHAACCPSHIERLLLINTAGVYYHGAEDLRQIFDIKASEDVGTLVDAMWYRYPWYFKPMRRAIRNDLLKRHVSEFVYSIETEDFLIEELYKLTMPLTLIWGMEDKLLSSETIEVVRNKVPTVELKLIEKCGHVPQLERPEAVLNILESVL